MEPATLPKHPHVGDMIATVFKNRRIRKAALSRMLGVAPSGVTGYVLRSTMQTDTLWKLSHALKHNFFADIASRLPADFASYVTPDTTKDDEIAQLKEEVARLKIEVAVLEKVALRRND